MYGLITLCYGRSQDTDFEKACRKGNLEAVESLLVKADFQMIYNGLVLAYRNKRR